MCSVAQGSLLHLWAGSWTVDDLKSQIEVATQGAIAGSAPVGAYVSRHNPDFNPSDFWEVRLGCMA